MCGLVSVFNWLSLVLFCHLVGFEFLFFFFCLRFRDFVMDSCFDSLAAVVPWREGWRFKVKILRMWEVPAFLNLDQPNSLEMVLIDEKVCVFDWCVFELGFIVCLLRNYDDMYLFYHI